MGITRQMIEDQKQERLGEINYNFYGNRMQIIKYNNTSNMVVGFDDGYTIKADYKEFKNGCIKYPCDKSVFGVGYLGIGLYMPSDNNGATNIYKTWKQMLYRCYDERHKIKEPTYKDCSVSEEWHNFQNFAKWYDENYYEVEKEQMNLDKDILIKNNKIYSPITCCFVTKRINALFIRKERHRGKYPIGVIFHKRDENFMVQCKSCGTSKRGYLGSFSTLEKAFQVYKSNKEDLIKKVADEYKDYIPQNLYHAMYRYEVEITD